MKFSRCIYIVFFIVLFSCSKDDDPNLDDLNLNKSGVVLTFDDDYVEDWKMADIKLKEYSWKATLSVFVELV